MMTKPSTLSEIFRIDETNVNESYRVLSAYGILGLYERLDALFDGILDAVKESFSSSSSIPLFRKNSDGTEVEAWDWLLRHYLLLSAQEQFLTAAQQLFRGRISQVFGHVRRAIEGAGIAYLSRTEPDIGDLFQARDRKNYKKRTMTEKILPMENPLTANLKVTIDFASNQIHNNLESFVSRHRQDISIKDGKINYDFHFDYHEVDQERLGYFLNISLWLLRAAERVALLLAASFNLPESEWHRFHQTFSQELDFLYQNLRDIILKDDNTSQVQTHG